MRAQTIDVKEATGRVLCCTVFRAGGKKLLAKGHVISEEDARMLETEGMSEVWVTELEEGEVGEDEAVMQVASEIGCGSLEIRLAAGGRANLFATEPCCLLVDDELLKQINCTASVVIATMLNFAYAKAGQRVATVKSTPFAVAGPQLEAVISIIKRERADSAGSAHSVAVARRVVYGSGEWRSSPPIVRKYYAPALGAIGHEQRFRPCVAGRRGLRGKIIATPVARQAHCSSNRIHNRVRWTGRCCGACHAARRVPV
jgi:hypothetical protein